MLIKISKSRSLLCRKYSQRNEWEEDLNSCSIWKEKNFVLKMIHISLKWAKSFQKAFYGFEKCIWKSFQKSWRLSWKKVLLNILESNQFPRLGPRAENASLFWHCRQAGTRSGQRWHRGPVQTGWQNSPLTKCQFQGSGKCFTQVKQGNILWMFLQPPPQLSWLQRLWISISSSIR